MLSGNGNMISCNMQWITDIVVNLAEHLVLLETFLKVGFIFKMWISNCNIINSKRLEFLFQKKSVSDFHFSNKNIFKHPLRTSFVKFKQWIHWKQFSIPWRFFLYLLLKPALITQQLGYFSWFLILSFYLDFIFSYQKIVRKNKNKCLRCNSTVFILARQL